MSEENLNSVDNEMVNELIVSDVGRNGNCYLRCMALATYEDENHHQEVRQKIVETMKMNRQIYQVYTKNFDYHEKNMERSVGHSNTWDTEAEILATSKAYKCNVFALKEHCIDTT